MYTKEQIIDEIKRVAKNLGKTSLSQKEFETNSTIPMSTVKYYMGTWSRAAEDAGLNSGKGEKKIISSEIVEDNDLLKDLIRLYNEGDTVPDLSAVEEKGKYDTKYYTTKWKSIHDAFVVAERKFPNEVKPRSHDDLLKDFEPQEETSANGQLSGIEEIAGQEEISRDIDFEIPNIYETKPKTMDKSLSENDNSEQNPIPEKTQEKGRKKVSDNQIDLDNFNLENGEPGGETASQGIRFIPKTIKPKKITKKRKFLGEPINFRGLKFGPVNRQGVIFLFGMVSIELGFIMESIRMENPDCEGMRCLDKAKNQWEHIGVTFELKSSDFQHRESDDDASDIIVCWEHDWEDSPFEILELKSTIKYLDND